MYALPTYITTSASDSYPNGFLPLSPTGFGTVVLPSIAIERAYSTRYGKTVDDGRRSTDVQDKANVWDDLYHHKHLSANVRLKLWSYNIRLSQRLHLCSVILSQMLACQ